jgi:hypothetical protein
VDAERVARNDATFRAANERIDATADQLGVESAPFICECADTSCTTVLRIALAEYEAIRADPTHFLNAPGHDAAGGPYAQVIEDRGSYVVVAKVGKAAEIVADLDERTISNG